MSAPDARTGAEALPAVVKVQRAAEDRDAKLAAAILELWDLLVRALGLSEAEKPGDPEAVADLRAQLAATSRREWADRTRAQMDNAHQAARRQSGVPDTRRRYDGSRARPVEDETDLAFERQRLLAKGQAARHAQMAAAGGYIGDASDAHKETRKEREEIYQRLREEGH